MSEFVPYGLYCYETLSIEPSKKYGFIMHTKSCDYYKHVDGIEGYCSLLKRDVWDAVKECDINDLLDEDIGT